MSLQVPPLVTDPNLIGTWTTIYLHGLAFGAMLMVPIFLAVRMKPRNKLANFGIRRTRDNFSYIAGGVTYFATLYTVATIYIPAYREILWAPALLMPFWHKFILNPFAFQKKVFELIGRFKDWMKTFRVSKRPDHQPPQIKVQVKIPPKKKKKRKPPGAPPPPGKPRQRRPKSP